MPEDCSAYANSTFFTPLIHDYLLEKESIRTLYNRFPNLENFKAQLDEKAANYPAHFREVLANSLDAQYQNITISAETKRNLAQLRESTTFTITTGHQLNIGTGPLYFVYKIITTINLCNQLKQTYPDKNFVPVYWMATEDHDLAEINHVYVKNKKVIWEKQGNGAVGRMDTQGMDKVIDQIKLLLGNSIASQEMLALFSESYLTSKSLAEATRKLVNSLFGRYGLVIVDGDSRELKTVFTPYIQNELTTQFSYTEVSSTIAAMNTYKIQVNPREINLFFIENNLRERIVFENNRYKVLNTRLEFSADEIKQLAANEPEKFSPNVLLRPLYQEVILPNLCYIGGGGELAYWLELNSMFAKAQVTFPVLLLRNSVVIASNKTKAKWEKTPLVWEDLFLTPKELIAAFISKTTSNTVDFTDIKQQLANQFTAMHEQAKATHPSFLNMLKAQEAKQMKGLLALEKRLHKAHTKAQQENIDRILSIQNDVFPGQKLAERTVNISEYYSLLGHGFIDELLAKLDPLKPKFTCLFFD
ncbi:MAG: bacillithiol biosynthesis cysteine-adding enzyme BshC [Flavobacterium sp.]|nr:bacillithiol biosynthesis cysteine-adding enzyme BshC [Flavobacterium sp.]